MSTQNIFASRLGILLLFVLLILVISYSFAWEPLSRNYVATDEVCSYCHVKWEYLHTARMSYTKPHPPEPDADQVHARCVDCHLPEGLWNTTYLYTHILSITDLFGHFREREAERAGNWIPLSAARAYRVRDMLQAYDSATCRSCHVEAETIPESIRGQTAHKDAMANGETCIECHSNLVHRFVEVRLTGSDDAGDGDMEGADEFDEFDEFEDDTEASDDGLEVL
jgi:nitrate/TMAO reductase-like tetraheme cytochrome c subunit